MKLIKTLFGSSLRIGTVRYFDGPLSIYQVFNLSCFHILNRVYLDQRSDSADKDLRVEHERLQNALSAYAAMRIVSA